MFGRKKQVKVTINHQALIRSHLLEAVKYITVFGGDEDTIINLAHDLDRLNVPRVEILRAVNEARADWKSGKVQEVIGNDEVEIPKNIIPFYRLSNGKINIDNCPEGRGLTIVSMAKETL
ncbi:MAG: hypothetical protein WCP18_02710 [bacterium]